MAACRRGCSCGCSSLISASLQGVTAFVVIMLAAFALPPWRTARAALHGGVSKAIASQGKLLLQESGGGVGRGEGGHQG